jgi:hypothetical protein
MYNARLNDAAKSNLSTQEIMGRAYKIWAYLRKRLRLGCLIIATTYIGRCSTYIT